MYKNIMKLREAKEMINNIIQGMDASGKEIAASDSFLHTPEAIRKFSLIADLISERIEYEQRLERKARKAFSITVEDLGKVQLPDHPIGINEFARCINQVIDIKTVKGISGTQINSKLKEAGILGERTGEDGKKCTVINNKSKQYGIEAVPGEYNGKKYEKVTFTDKGKAFLMDHFIELMQLDEVSAAE